MGIKLIVTDLDGTFLDTYHTLNEENVKAVRRAREQGIYVAAVTARNWSACKWAVTETGFDPLCVINNGAAIVEGSSEKLAFENTIPAPAVRAILQAAAEAKASIDVFAGMFSLEYEPTRLSTKDMVQWRTEWEKKPAHCRPVVEVYQDLEKMIQRASDVSENITVHGKDLTELPGWFYRRVIEQGEFYLTSSHTGCIDIMAYGSTKREGVERLAGMLRVKQEEVVAFGDNSNDIGMLKWAGTGVAVGNAAPSVQAAADMVTARNDEGGFAKALETLIF